MGKPNIVSDSRRAAAQKHVGRVTTCDCGKKCLGNGGWSSHKKACPVFQALRVGRVKFEQERVAQYMAEGRTRAQAEVEARCDWHRQQSTAEQ